MQNIHLLMDETDRPYEENEFKQTYKQKKDLVLFAEENQLELDPHSELGKIQQVMHMQQDMGINWL